MDLLLSILLTICKDQGKGTGEEGCAALEWHSELLGVLLPSLRHLHNLLSLFDAVEPSTGKELPEGAMALWDHGEGAQLP
jgi:hypothetical protein